MRQKWKEKVIENDKEDNKNKVKIATKSEKIAEKVHKN